MNDFFHDTALLNSFKTYWSVKVLILFLSVWHFIHVYFAGSLILQKNSLQRKRSRIHQSIATDKDFHRAFCIFSSSSSGVFLLFAYQNL